MKKTNLNKNIFLWALYNFANTPITVAMGGLFLAQWVVLDNKFDDIWYGTTFTLATIVLLITSPFLGAWSDAVGKRMPFLKWTTYIQVIVGLLLGFVAVLRIATIPKVITVLVLFSSSNIFIKSVSSFIMQFWMYYLRPLIEAEFRELPKQPTT